MLPKSGDHIILFQLDARSAASSYKSNTQRLGNKGTKNKSASQPTDFTQSGECQVIGDLHFPKLKDIASGKDKII